MTTAALPALQNDPSGSRWHRQHSALIFVVALAFALRLPWMTQSLWYDEISVTRHYLADTFHLLEAWAFESNMPVHYTLMFFWDKVFPDTEFWLRFPPLLFGLGSIVLCYQIALAVFNRRVALLTSLLLGISPVHIWYSAEARPYAGMMFFLLLAFLAFVRLHGPAASSGKVRVAWWSIYFLSLSLGTLSHMYMAVLVVYLSAISLFQRKRAVTFLALNVAVLGLLAGFLWFKHQIAGYIPYGAFYLRPFSPWEAWLLFFNWYATGNTLFQIGRDATSWRDLPLGALGCQLFFCAVFLIGLVAVVRGQNAPGRWWGTIAVSLLFCIPLFLLAINAFGLRSSYIERSCFVTLPFFFMTLANAALPARQTRWSLLVLSGVLLLSGLSTLSLFRYPSSCAIGPCKPDWRSAASYLRGDIGTAGQKVAAVGMQAERSLPYYDDEFADRARLERLQQHLPRLRQMASDVFGPDTAVVSACTNEMQDVDSQIERDRDKVAVLSLVDVRRAPPGSYDALYAMDPSRSRRGAGRLLQWLGQHDYRLIEERSFPALRIYKFARR